MQKTGQKRTAGRPPKFDERRRPVTVTLPQRVLDTLESVDADRARAIVRVTETAVGSNKAEQSLVELVEIGPRQCILVVGRSRQLQKIPWLKLVEIAPARNLLIIPPGTPIETLEVSLSDLAEDAPGNTWEGRMLTELRLLIGRMRREKRISKGEIIFFSTPPTARKETRPQVKLSSHPPSM